MSGSWYFTCSCALPFRRAETFIWCFWHEGRATVELRNVETWVFVQTFLFLLSSRVLDRDLPCRECNFCTAAGIVVPRSDDESWFCVCPCSDKSRTYFQRWWRLRACTAQKDSWSFVSSLKLCNAHSEGQSTEEKRFLALSCKALVKELNFPEGEALRELRTLKKNILSILSSAK